MRAGGTQMHRDWKNKGALNAQVIQEKASGEPVDLKWKTKMSVSDGFVWSCEAKSPYVNNWAVASSEKVHILPKMFEYPRLWCEKIEAVFRAAPVT